MLLSEGIKIDHIKKIVENNTKTLNSFIDILTEKKLNKDSPIKIIIRIKRICMPHIKNPTGPAIISSARYNKKNRATNLSKIILWDCSIV